MFCLYPICSEIDLDATQCSKVHLQEHGLSDRIVYHQNLMVLKFTKKDSNIYCQLTSDKQFNFHQISVVGFRKSKILLFSC